MPRLHDQCVRYLTATDTFLLNQTTHSFAWALQDKPFLQPADFLCKGHDADIFSSDKQQIKKIPHLCICVAILTENPSSTLSTCDK